MPIQAETRLYLKTKCRYCESPLPKAFLDLGTMPLANSFLTREELFEEEFVCPLCLTWCPQCGLVQLTHTVPSERMFSNYLYVSSTTQTFRQHFSEYAKEARAKLQKKGSLIVAVDIGSNDGLLLSYYQNEGMKAIGIEPAKNLAREADQKGLTTIPDYFGEPAVNRVLKMAGPADILSGNNVFAHIDDIHGLLRNAARLLASQGIFIIEFPYLVKMFDEMLFDMIYHEHLSYIAVTPLERLLGRFGLEIFSIREVASHGGSLRVFIQKQGAGRSRSPEVDQFLKREAQQAYGTFAIYQQFSERVYQVKKELVEFVRRTKAEGKSVAGYGAAAKANTLINFCGWTSSDLDYVVDDNPLKQNRFSPGARLPVVSNRHLFEHPVDTVILFAWNFAEEIVRKLEPLRGKGVQFLTPLPRPRLIEPK